MYIIKIGYLLLIVILGIAICGCSETSNEEILNQEPPVDNQKLPVDAPPIAEPPIDEPMFELVDEGVLSNIKTQRFDIISDAAALDNVWIEHGAGLREGHQKPVIDFNFDQMLALFLGEKLSGGYAIIVEGVDVFDDRLDVNIVETVPGNGCPVTLGFTRPYQFIQILKTDKMISFLIRSETVDCV